MNKKKPGKDFFHDVIPGMKKLVVKFFRKRFTSSSNQTRGNTMTDTTFRHTPEMGEISGFGGGYEKTCQDMLENGVKWLMENKDRTLDIGLQGWEGIYGVVNLTGKDGDALEKAVMDGIDDCTGAMHHTVMSRLMYIKCNGWDTYAEGLIEREK